MYARVKNLDRFVVTTKSAFFIFHNETRINVPYDSTMPCYEIFMHRLDLFIIDPT